MSKWMEPDIDALEMEYAEARADAEAWTTADDATRKDIVAKYLDDEDERADALAQADIFAAELDKTWRALWARHLFELAKRHDPTYDASDVGWAEGPGQWAYDTSQGDWMSDTDAIWEIEHWAKEEA